MNLRAAIRIVNDKGILLVFPQENKKEPPSLWYEFFPRTKMRWEWDDTGDNRVAELWHLRERLSTSGQVVYSKWYKGKATVFSFKVFTALLRLMNPDLPDVHNLSFAAREILDLLEEDSPLSTKRLKKLAGLQGRESETQYTRALRELWNRQLIVVFGEVDEGAFPSIAIGATKVLFEEQWREACAMEAKAAEARFYKTISAQSAFGKFFARQYDGRANKPEDKPEDNPGHEQMDRPKDEPNGQSKAPRKKVLSKKTMKKVSN